MLEQYQTKVWDTQTAYRIPLQIGVVSGRIIVVESRNHWLQTGDIVNVEAASGYESFAVTGATIIKVDEDHFSYQVTAAPSIPFPNPRPGLAIVLWLTC